MNVINAAGTAGIAVDTCGCSVGAKLQFYYSTTMFVMTSRGVVMTSRGVVMTSRV